MKSEFYKLVIAMQAKHKDWRFGQCLFNALDMLNPQLADSVRGTDKDPFYGNNTEQFLEFIENNLND